MSTQLRLIEPTEVSWRLDEHTKTIGRRGIAKARAALAAARVPSSPEATPTRPSVRAA